MAATTALQPGVMTPGMNASQALTTTGGGAPQMNDAGNSALVPSAGAGGLLAPVKTWAEQPQVKKVLPYMILAVALLRVQQLLIAQVSPMLIPLHTISSLKDFLILIASVFPILILTLMMKAVKRYLTT